MIRRGYFNYLLTLEPNFDKFLVQANNIYWHSEFQPEIMYKLYTFFLDIGLRYSEIPTNESKTFSFSFDDNYMSWKGLSNFDHKLTFYLNTCQYNVNFDETAYVRSIGHVSDYKFLPLKDLCDLGSRHNIGFHGTKHHKHSRTDRSILVNDFETQELFFRKIGICNVVNQYAINYGMRRFLNPYFVKYLRQKNINIVLAEPGMLKYTNSQFINRYNWVDSISFENNLKLMTFNKHFYLPITPYRL